MHKDSKPKVPNYTKTLILPFTHSDMVTTLLRHGSVVNMLDDRGRTPLYWAIVNNSVTLMKHLLVAGADVTQVRAGTTTISFHNLYRFDCDYSKQVCAILVLSGYKFNMDDDDDDEDNTDTDEAPVDDATNEIERIAAQRLPLSLQQQCANIIRRRLRPNALCAVKQLPLPHLLKDAILFHENESHSESASEDICSTSN